MGGGVGEIHGAKLVGLLQRAQLERPAAVLLLADSGGVRLHEANAGLIAVSEVMRTLLDTRACGVPVISTTGGANPSIEYPNVFQFLADVDDITTSYIDNGSIVPDYTIRLNDIHGYYGWSMWPLPTDEQAMEYQLRATRRPAPLLNGNDSPRIVPSCEDALTFFLVAYIARHDKDVKTAELYEAKAAEVLEKYRSRQANPTGIVPREAWDGGGANTGWPQARL